MPGAAQNPWRSRGGRSRPQQRQRLAWQQTGGSSRSGGEPGVFSLRGTSGSCRCSGQGEGGEPPEKDAQRVLPARGYGPAAEKLLRLSGWALPPGREQLCAGREPPCPAAGSTVPTCISQPGPAVRLHAAGSHDPGSEASKLPPCLSRRPEEGEGGADGLPRPKVGREPGRLRGGWTGDHGDRAGSHGSIHLAVLRIFTG